MNALARLLACTVISINLAACGGDDGDNDRAFFVSVQSLEDRLDSLETQLSQQDSVITALQSELQTAYQTIDGLESRLTCLSYDAVTRNLLIEGCNVHIRDGSGDTASTTGLGNLIIGYNRNSGNTTGTHNLVIGDGHGYTSFGGFVAGHNNTLASPYASVSGGEGLVVNSQSGWAAGGVSQQSDTLSVNTGSLDMQLTRGADIHASSVNLASATSLVMTAQTLLDIQSASTTRITSSATTSIRGGMIMLNAATNAGLPAARVTDRVSVMVGSEDTPAMGNIMTGSTTVMIGN